MPANANVLKDDESVIFDKSKKQLLFVQFGKCDKCIRNAAGRLIGPSNENYGIFCKPCAKVQIRKIEKDTKRLRADKNGAGDRPRRMLPDCLRSGFQNL